MPVGSPAAASAVNIVTTAATTILSGIISPFDDIDLPNALTGNTQSPAGALCSIRGTANIAVAAGATTVTLRCFNNAGTAVGSARTTTVTASATAEISFFFRDMSPYGNNQYSIQATVNGASANSMVNFVDATADMPG